MAGLLCKQLSAGIDPRCSAANSIRCSQVCGSTPPGLVYQAWLCSPAVTAALSLQNGQAECTRRQYCPCKSSPVKYCLFQEIWEVPHFNEIVPASKRKQQRKSPWTLHSLQFGTSFMRTCRTVPQRVGLCAAGRM